MYLEIIHEHDDALALVLRPENLKVLYEQLVVDSFVVEFGMLEARAFRDGCQYGSVLDAQ